MTESIKRYLYASKKIHDFSSLNPPSSAIENVKQDRVIVPIEKQTNESCDINKLINSIHVTLNSGTLSPDTDQ